MAPLLRPRALRAGDVVAIAAVSGGLEPNEAPLLEHGRRELERLGFVVRVSPLVSLDLRHWYGPATPAETAAELNGLLRDPAVRAVFALTGGRGALPHLDLLDLAAVRADPKPLIGFSDIGVLHLALHAATGLAGVHGDLVTHGFGYWHEDEAWSSRLAASYRAVLTGEAAGALPATGAEQCWRPGRAEGPLVGAMLNRLVRMQATRFALPPERFDGAILFWEETAAVSQVWNDLQVLRLAGVLARIAGMVVGPLATIEAPEGEPSVQDVVLAALGDRDVPVLADVPIGHEPPDWPLPLGVRAALDADARTLSLVEPAAV
ncbi:LD-carboxypeptidase [Amnibacterium sp. CER49]|uniref:S66 peptidase family protein n=1 Tax=Amnibacterium sp. CER49 TaxID=3039161 RepID=UPI00244A5819|nr:LD-carboxypeptidase [Amnibacterium sp. CER49]MDH2443822.1 LD-carboxypeptidase [Amnibacterium sp. CER49]